MINKFVVITEIYYESQKISRVREEVQELTVPQKHILIKSLFKEFFGTMRKLDVLAKIITILKERFNINIQERQIYNILGSKYNFLEE